MKVLELLNIKNYFDTIVSGEDVKNGKPAPDIFLLTCQKLKVKPEECIAIEDSQNGVLSAKNGNLKCIAVPTSLTKHMDFSKADYIIDNLIKIKNIL